jgi:hypothetical protein
VWPAVGYDVLQLLKNETRMPTAAPTAMNPDSRVIPGRECGTCTLCCKVYNIPEIGKPAGKWCQHCTPGKGCGIHQNLPSQCATFNCMWRTEAALPPHWKPEQSKMVITIFPLNGFIYVQVDPGAPSAWRKQPYYDQLRLWAKNNLKKGIHVIVFLNDIATLIMPDEDVPLGPMKPTDGISVRRNAASGPARYEVTLIPGGTAGLRG